ncbi:MAG: group II intron maturase-specific domain-containing protein [Desulfotomaculaceae bacterium]|nr:group II intron maturase-specific domain-containing protein [Desulfotomaculaceae bacterium]
MGWESNNAGTKVNQVVRGWTNYFFKLADEINLLINLDEWLRSRIRMVTWKRWKKIRTRFANLKSLG